MFDINTKVGNNEINLEIKEVYVDIVEFPKGGSSNKLYIRCDSDTDNEFIVSEAWCKKGKDLEEVHGLWITLDDGGNIYSNSALGKLLIYNKVDSALKLVGKNVKGYSDYNGHIVLSTFDK